MLSCTTLLMATLFAGTVESPRLTMEAGEKLGKMPDMLLTYNAQLMMHDVPWDDPSFLEQLEWLRPEGLRFPGGTVANYYNWRTGFFDTDHPLTRERFVNAGRRVERVHGPSGYRLEEFKTAIEASGAAPVFVVNMLTSTLEEQIAWLQHAESLGLPIKYVELGNEFYLPDKSNVARFPTANDYAAEAVEWAKAIKKEFPDAKLAAVGSGYKGREGRAHREDDWNERLGDLEGIDAVTLHVYYGTGLNVLYPGHPQYQPREGAELENIPGRSMTGPDWAREQQSEWLRTPGIRQRAFDQVFIRHKETLTIMEELEGKEIWLTEHNYFDRVGPVQMSWIRGLGCALAVTLFLDRPEHIVMGGHHNLGGGEAFAVLLYQQNMGDTVPTAVAHTYRALSKPFEDALEVGTVKISPRIPLIVDGKDSGNPGVLARWFRGEKANWMVVFNLTDDVHKMKSPFADGESSFTLLTAEDTSARIAGNEGLTQLEGKLEGYLELPPLSLAIVRQER